MQICSLVYKYGIGLDEVLSLTIPQLHIMEECLLKICKAENGEGDKPSKESNTIAFAETIRYLQKETGRKEFTLEEANNPAETIKKYKRV